MMDVVPAERSSQARSRATCYGFLAWLFMKQPDQTFVSRILAQDMLDNFGLLAIGAVEDSRIVAGLNEMISSVVASGSRSIDDISQALAVEWTGLMRGVGRPDGLPPPYESLYRSPEAGGATALLEGLAGFYRQAQARLPEQQTDQIDYLGLELDLMRLMCEEESHSWDQADAESAAGFALLQERFLREHLLVWVPRFCEKLIKQPHVSFYRGVGQLLFGFLEEEIVPSGSWEPERLSQAGSGE